MELLGTMVIVVNHKQHNGSFQHPAIVNRHWDGANPPDGAVGYINCMLFPDCGTPYCETSVWCFDTEGAASAYVQDCQEKDYKPTVAFLVDEPEVTSWAKPI